MNKQEIKRMIAYHQAEYNRVKAVLDERYYELEEKNLESVWVKEYLKQKDILDWLGKQNADDE